MIYISEVIATIGFTKYIFVVMTLGYMYDYIVTGFRGIDFNIWLPVSTNDINGVFISFKLIHQNGIL